MRRLSTICIVVSCLAAIAHGQLFIDNPDWRIEMLSSGYSDILLDKRPGFVGREYLSGEWATALGYTIVNGPTVSPQWVEREFIYPDWTTNSTFNVQTPIYDTGLTNSTGFSIYESAMANNHLEIKFTYQMVDTLAATGFLGMEQGLTPRSASGSSGSQASGRYVLHQEMEVTNLTSELIEDLNLFQFLHGLVSETGVIDDNNHGGAFDTYKYDATLRGKHVMHGGSQSYVHDDIIAFHSEKAPVEWEVGAYGQLGVDSHGVGKPSSGVHLSVESDALSGNDAFLPATPWVSGSQKFNLLQGMPLKMGESVTHDVFLSVHTTTTIVPEPSSAGLLVALCLGLAGIGRRWA